MPIHSGYLHVSGYTPLDTHLVHTDKSTDTLACEDMVHTNYMCTRNMKGCACLYMHRTHIRHELTLDTLTSHWTQAKDTGVWGPDI